MVRCKHIQQLLSYHSSLSIVYQNNGSEIKWSHLVELAEISAADSGLYIGKKLSREHLALTSYSRMTVRLAVQVVIAKVFSYIVVVATVHNIIASPFASYCINS